MKQEVKKGFKGKNVLITGGLGMIGSTIAGKLVECGAHVTILDACFEVYGANYFNIENIKNNVKVIVGDIRDKKVIEKTIKNNEIIFSLAAQVSHNDSIEDPFLDADINYFGHLNVLENIKKHNKKAVVVYSGSRLQYGKISAIPVDEQYPLRPETPYALNKAAAENMYAFYHKMYGISCIMFRISNPYGMRSQMKHSKYSIVNWFIRQAIEDQEMQIFGNGEQIRDYIYVDDLADAMIMAVINKQCYGQVYNIGRGHGTTFKEMVSLVTEIAQGGTVRYIDWPKDYINVETGNYVSNISKICAAIDWHPKVDLQ